MTLKNVLYLQKPIISVKRIKINGSSPNEEKSARRVTLTTVANCDVKYTHWCATCTCNSDKGFIRILSVSRFIPFRFWNRWNSVLVLYTEDTNTWMRANMVHTDGNSTVYTREARKNSLELIHGNEELWLHSGLFGVLSCIVCCLQLVRTVYTHII